MPDKKFEFKFPKPVLTREQQILELCATTKCSLKPSKIHGVGVFALRDIKKDERCYLVSDRAEWLTLNFTDLKKLDKTYPEIKELILSRWPQVVNGSKFMAPNLDTRFPAFLNHSDEPNYNPLSDTALKDIKEGEELTEDYRAVENFEKVYPWLKSK